MGYFLALLLNLEICYPEEPAALAPTILISE